MKNEERRTKNQEPENAQAMRAPGSHAAGILPLPSSLIVHPSSLLAPRSPLRLRSVLLLLGLLLGAYLLLDLGWRWPTPVAASSPQVKVFFTTPDLVYPDRPERRLVSPLVRTVVADIDAARQAVDMAVFDLDVNEIADALVRAQRRGVMVRLVLDSENLVTPEVAAAAGQLQRAGARVVYDRREPFMHDKFIILDHAVTWTGSWNITVNDTFRNNNNALRFVSRALAASYTRQFEHMAAGSFGSVARVGGERLRVGALPVEVYFSPEGGAEERLLARLEAAQHSINFLAFSYTSQPIAAAMADAVRRGVRVQGVMEAKNAAGLGAQLGTLRNGGADVLEDGNCYALHHKVIVIDERTVITGSYNFTGSAEHSNDENMIIVDDANLARAYLDEFARLYAQAQSPVRCL